MSKQTAQSLHSSPKATVCVIWESTAQGKGCSFSFLHIQKNVQSRIYLVFKELPCMDQKLLVVVQLLKNMWSHKNKCKSQMTWNISLLPPSPTPPLSLSNWVSAMMASVSVLSSSIFASVIPTRP